jgi:hypothetical protein
VAGDSGEAGGEDAPPELVLLAVESDVGSGELGPEVESSDP